MNSRCWFNFSGIMKYIFLLIYSIIAIVATGQNSFVLKNDVIQGITSVDERHFGDEELWGYINGGADLYLEYGFKNLTVFDIKTGSADYKADIYVMNSPEAAFGIFSISRFKCSETSKVAENDCLTPYQYTAAKGNVYLSVSNSAGSPGIQQSMLDIAAQILDQVENINVQVPALFKQELLLSQTDNLKFIQGPLGVQNGLVRWEPLFNNISNYKVWVLPVKQEHGNYYVACIAFSDKAEMQSFLQKNQLLHPVGHSKTINNKVFTVFAINDLSLILTEGSLPEQLKELLQKQ